MNRRNFLKSIGKVVGGLVVAPSVVKARPKKESVDKFDALAKRVRNRCKQLEPTIKSFEKRKQLASEYFVPAATKIERLRQTTSWAEAKGWKINKILCKPEFMKGLIEEINSQGFLWPLRFSMICKEGEFVKICGYKVEVSECTLGDYALDCDEVYAVFQNGGKYRTEIRRGDILLS